MSKPETTKDEDCPRCRGGGCEWCHNTGRRNLKLRCNGIGRNAEWPKSLLFYFDTVPSDDQMRFLHEVMKRACACLPEGRDEERTC